MFPTHFLISGHYLLTYTKLCRTKVHRTWSSPDILNCWEKTSALLTSKSSDPCLYLSIMMTACSMLLGLGMMPLLLLIYRQGFPNLHEALPYVGIVITLSSLLLASGLGILINFYRPQNAKTVAKVSGETQTALKDGWHHTRDIIGTRWRLSYTEFYKV